MYHEDVIAAVEEARKAWSQWQERWADVQREMEAAGMSTNRIEAYRVGTGYDEGGGHSIQSWMQEVEDDARGVPDGMCPCGMYPRGEHGCDEEAFRM